MALTRRDETDLLLPLFDGIGEDPPFSNFLERLRRRVGAVHVSITIRPGEAGEPLSLFVGPDVRQLAYELNLAELNLTDRIQYDRLRPGRVYSGDEFDDHDPVRKARRARDMRKLGLTDERVVRILDDAAASAWLILACDRLCTGADAALLSNLAPYVAGAVRTFVGTDRQKLAAALNADGLRRAGSGWIVFDKLARVLAISRATEEVLTGVIGQRPPVGQRLRLGQAADKGLVEAAAAFGRGELPRDIALSLCDNPIVEALLSAPPPGTMPVLDAPAMVAYCRHPREPRTGRADLFAALHALPRREAELAIHLADGLSLAEAAHAMDLTIETTRNYSKRLFAKAGVHSQAELIRAVYESCAILA